MQYLCCVDDSHTCDVIYIYRYKVLKLMLHLLCKELVDCSVSMLAVELSRCNLFG